MVVLKSCQPCGIIRSGGLDADLVPGSLSREFAVAFTALEATVFRLIVLSSRQKTRVEYSECEVKSPNLVHRFFVRELAVTFGAFDTRVFCATVLGNI